MMDTLTMIKESSPFKMMVGGDSWRTPRGDYKEVSAEGTDLDHKTRSSIAKKGTIGHICTPIYVSVPTSIADIIFTRLESFADLWGLSLIRIMQK